MAKLTTFVLGAGFSAEQGYPLARDMKERVLHFLEAERHLSYACHLTPIPEFPNGQFYAGLQSIDPDGERGFEELLIALRDHLPEADRWDPCFVTEKVLRIGAARFLWCCAYLGRPVDEAYRRFARQLSASAGACRVVTFNWDILVEQSLAEVEALWKYSLNGDPAAVCVIKPHGSINWTAINQHPNLSTDYQGLRPIGVGSTLSFDSTNPFEHPDSCEIHSDLRFCLFAGDPDLPETHPDLRLLWQDASVAIDQSEEVVFIGYSLPAYDSFAAQTLKKLCADKQVTVYDPSENTLRRFAEEFPSAVLFASAFSATPFATSTTA
jgi:hypothetical protein